MEQVLYVLLGWLLGLLGPRAVDRIQRPYRREELRRTLFLELEELRIKLAYNTFLVASRQGKIDRSLVEWLQPIVGEYKGFYANPDIVKFINSLATMSDVDLARLPADPPGRSLQFKKYTVPFLRSQMPSLSLFSLDFQRQLLEIGAKLDGMSEDIDTLWYYHAKTFDSALAANNAEVVRRSVEEYIEAIGRRSHALADDIGKLLETS